MPILHAELQIAGRQVACDVASFSFSQATDDKGRPSSVVRVGLLQVLISGEAAGWHLWEEIKFNPYRRESGHVVFFQNEGITAKRYTFYDAALVSLQFRHDGKGASRQAATQVELHFSAATIELNGIRLEAHSLIPWETDAPTSFRALTQPTAPKPSAHLAAGLGLLASKAAQAIPEIIEKAAPIALEGVARTITLLPVLLLDPVNGNADPAKDYDNLLAARNHQQQHQAIPLPPQSDEVRLAELEHALATQTLTAQEEAELIVLLAKVKGIHVQHLNELNPENSVLSSSRPTKPYKNKKKLLGNGPSKQKSKREQYLGSTPRKTSATGTKVIKRMESEGKIQPDSIGEKQVLGPDGNWHSIKQTDMGHLHDAVNWWNAEGRKHGAKSLEVRKWMLDPDNYELEPSSINRSRGGKLKDRYLPPLK